MFEVKEHNILGWEKYYNIYIKNSGQNSRFITINVNRYISNFIPLLHHNKPNNLYIPLYYSNKDNLPNIVDNLEYLETCQSLKKQLNNDTFYKNLVSVLKNTIKRWLKLKDIKKLYIYFYNNDKPLSLGVLVETFESYLVKYQSINKNNIYMYSSLETKYSTKITTANIYKLSDGQVVLNIEDKYKHINKIKHYINKYGAVFIKLPKELYPVNKYINVIKVDTYIDDNKSQKMLGLVLDNVDIEDFGSSIHSANISSLNNCLVDHYNKQATHLFFEYNKNKNSYNGEKFYNLNFSKKRALHTFIQNNDINYPIIEIPEAYKKLYFDIDINFSDNNNNNFQDYKKTIYNFVSGEKGNFKILENILLEIFNISSLEFNIAKNEVNKGVHIITNIIIYNNQKYTETIYREVEKRIVEKWIQSEPDVKANIFGIKNIHNAFMQNYNKNLFTNINLNLSDKIMYFYLNSGKEIRHYITNDNKFGIKYFTKNNKNEIDVGMYVIFSNKLNFEPEYTIDNRYYYKIKNEKYLEKKIAKTILDVIEFNQTISNNLYKSNLLLETFEYLLTNEMKGRYNLMKNISELYYNIIINNNNINYYWIKLIGRVFNLLYHSINLIDNYLTLPYLGLRMLYTANKYNNDNSIYYPYIRKPDDNTYYLDKNKKIEHLENYSIHTDKLIITPIKTEILNIIDLEQEYITNIKENIENNINKRLLINAKISERKLIENFDLEIGYLRGKIGYNLIIRFDEILNNGIEILEEILKDETKSSYIVINGVQKSIVEYLYALDNNNKLKELFNLLKTQDAIIIMKIETIIVNEILIKFLVEDLSKLEVIPKNDNELGYYIDRTNKFRNLLNINLNINSDLKLRWWSGWWCAISFGLGVGAGAAAANWWEEITDWTETAWGDFADWWEYQWNRHGGALGKHKDAKY